MSGALFSVFIAITYFDTILNFDNSNNDAQSFKDDYHNEIQKIAAEAKKAEEDRIAAMKENLLHKKQ